METNEELALRVKAGDSEAVAALWEQTKKLAYQFCFLLLQSQYGLLCGFRYYP